MTKVSLQTRKPVQELCAADFRDFPVWEYASNEESASGQDETWVRPVNTRVVPKNSYVEVAAEFIAANGTKFDGCVIVSTLDGAPEVCQGSIFHGAASLFVSNPEAVCYEESRANLLNAVQLTEAQMFPLSFELRIPVAGHPEYSGGTLP